MAKRKSNKHIPLGEGIKDNQKLHGIMSRLLGDVQVDPIQSLVPQVSPNRRDISKDVKATTATTPTKKGPRGLTKLRAEQSRLKQAGHYKGAIDGKMGPLTRQAMRDDKNAPTRPNPITGNPSKGTGYSPIDNTLSALRQGRSDFNMVSDAQRPSTLRPSTTRPNSVAPQTENIPALNSILPNYGQTSFEDEDKSSVKSRVNKRFETRRDENLSDRFELANPDSPMGNFSDRMQDRLDEGVTNKLDSIKFEDLFQDDLDYISPFEDNVTGIERESKKRNQQFKDDNFRDRMRFAEKKFYDSRKSEESPSLKQAEKRFDDMYDTLKKKQMGADYDPDVSYGITTDDPNDPMQVKYLKLKSKFYDQEVAEGAKRWEVEGKFNEGVGGRKLQTKGGKFTEGFNQHKMPTKTKEKSKSKTDSSKTKKAQSKTSALIERLGSSVERDPLGWLAGSLGAGTLGAGAAMLSAPAAAAAGPTGFEALFAAPTAAEAAATAAQQAAMVARVGGLGLNHGGNIPQDLNEGGTFGKIGNVAGALAPLASMIPGVGTAVGAGLQGVGMAADIYGSMQQPNVPTAQNTSRFNTGGNMGDPVDPPIKGRHAMIAEYERRQKLTHSTKRKADLSYDAASLGMKLRSLEDPYNRYYGQGNVTDKPLNEYATQVNAFNEISPELYIKKLRDSAVDAPDARTSKKRRYNTGGNMGDPTDPPSGFKSAMTPAQQQMLAGIPASTFDELPPGRQKAHMQGNREHAQLMGEANQMEASQGFELESLKNLLKNPMQEFMPQTNQQSPQRLNNGGQILSNDSFQVQGKSGIDTNKFSINGKKVNLTKGETVDTSKNRVMSNEFQLGGQQFSEIDKALKRSRGRAEKTIQQVNPNDPHAKNTVKMTHQLEDQLFEMQEDIATKMGLREDQQPQGFNTGGQFPGDPLLDVMGQHQQPLGVQPIGSLAPQLNRVNPSPGLGSLQSLQQQSPTGFNNQPSAGGQVPNSPGIQSLDPQFRANDQTGSSGDPNNPFDIRSDMSNTGTDPRTSGRPGTENPLGMSLGDKIQMGAKGVELIGRGIQEACC